MRLYLANSKRAIWVALLAAMALWPGAASADTLYLGWLSLNELIPGDASNPVGVIAVSIDNYTGGSAVPPGFPVISDLNFLNSKIAVNTTKLIALGDIGPGSYSSDLLTAPDTTVISSVSFSATLGSLVFETDGAGLFQADSAQIAADIAPTQGPDLQPGDFALISISASPVTTVIPEPAGVVLLATALAMAVSLARKKR